MSGHIDLFCFPCIGHSELFWYFTEAIRKTIKSVFSFVFHLQVLCVYLFRLQWWTRVPQPTAPQMVGDPFNSPLVKFGFYLQPEFTGNVGIFLKFE